MLFKYRLDVLAVPERDRLLQEDLLSSPTEIVSVLTLELAITLTSPATEIHQRRRPSIPAAVEEYS